MARLLRRLTVVAGAAEAARRYVKNNPEKVNRMAEKAARFVDKRTKGRYHGQINEAMRKMRAATDQRPHPGSHPGTP